MQPLRRWLRIGDTFIDLGANEGYFSVIAGSLVEPTGRVLAVEPQARLHAVITRNCAENNINNVSIIPRAVSCTKGSQRLYLATNTNPGASGFSRATSYPLSSVGVETSTLSDILLEQGVTHCRLLKIDIEGFEYEAVLGSRGLFLTHRIGALALELHDENLRCRGKDPAEICQFLQNCSYTRDSEAGNLVLASGAPGTRI